MTGTKLKHSLWVRLRLSRNSVIAKQYHLDKLRKVLLHRCLSNGVNYW